MNAKKVVLITGASAGIGKETANLQSLGIKVLAMDVTDEGSMLSGIDTLIKAEGRIDILVNNAGFGSYGAVEDVPIADARYQLEVNVFGTARLTQLVLPYMDKQHYCHPPGRLVPCQ